MSKEKNKKMAAKKAKEKLYAAKKEGKKVYFRSQTKGKK